MSCSVKMAGRPTHLSWRRFEIQRYPGRKTGRAQSKYCYALKFNGHLLRHFEFQREARAFLREMIRDCGI